MKFIESYVNELLTTALTMMLGFYLGMGWWVMGLALIGGAFITLGYLKEKRASEVYRRERRRGYGWHEHRERDIKDTIEKVLNENAPTWKEMAKR